MKRQRFEINDEGWREMQLGRQPFSLAKEPVSNFFDEESVTEGKVTLTKEGHQAATLIFEDNGNGFENITDSWTLFRTTNKRERPDMRGRFNLGEKEILSIATDAKVTSSGRIVSFPREGGREVTRQKEVSKGVKLELRINWTKDEVKECIKKLKQIIPPKRVKYFVNEKEVRPRDPYKVIECPLETVLLSKDTIPPMMRSTTSRTQVFLYKVLQGETPTIFELGIPIQEIDCPVHIDIQQKVPLNPNRDTVKDKYLQDVYAETLNLIVDELTEEQVSEKWIRIALEDQRCVPETALKVRDKRYGSKVVLRSSDTTANERALGAGYTIIDSRTLSSAEREKFEESGLLHSSKVFGSTPAEAKDVVETKGMKLITKYAKSLASHLLGKEINVTFHSLFGGAYAAQYGLGELSFNVARIGKSWFELGVCPETTGLIIHELAHDGAQDPDYAHGPVYLRRLEQLIGQLPFLAIKQPEIFKEETYKVT